MGAGGTMSVATNKPSRPKLVLLGGLSIVALAVGIRLVSSGPESAPAATVTPSTPDTPGAGGADAPTAAKAPVSINWPADVARDPFHSDLVFPPAAPPSQQPVEVPVVAPAPVKVDLATLVREKIHLKGTILGERPVAMMNGRVYRVGEVVDGFTIIEIEKNRITVERDGTRFVVGVN
jgi:hypothetical protein